MPFRLLVRRLTLSGVLRRVGLLRGEGGDRVGHPEELHPDPGHDFAVLSYIIGG